MQCPCHLCIDEQLPAPGRVGVVSRAVSVAWQRQHLRPWVGGWGRWSKLWQHEPTEAAAATVGICVAPTSTADADALRISEHSGTATRNANTPTSFRKARGVGDPAAVACVGGCEKWRGLPQNRYSFTLRSEPDMFNWNTLVKWLNAHVEGRECCS